MNGYAFAAFRSHNLHMKDRRLGRTSGSWTIPNVHADTLPHSGWQSCACKDSYDVRHDYHYHSIDGKCHNTVKCV